MVMNKTVREERNLTAVAGIALMLWLSACAPITAPLPASEATVAQVTNSAVTTESVQSKNAATATIATVIVKLNLNRATSEEFPTIPEMNNLMVHEFEEYRPYISIQQFRKEIGKYVDEARVAAYEMYVYVPVVPNTSDAETLQQLPGVTPEIAEKMIAARPYETSATFLNALAAHVTPDELTIGETYLENEQGEEVSSDITTAPLSTAIDASDYCVEQGGMVVSRRATYGIDDDTSELQQLHAQRDFCDFFTTESTGGVVAGSTISLDLATLWSTEPTLATLAYYDPPPTETLAEGEDPVEAYCTRLGGTTGFDGVTGKAGAWVAVSEGGSEDGEAVTYCLFPDGSMLGAVGLTANADWSVLGTDLRSVLRYRPDQLPDIYPGCEAHDATAPGFEALPVTPNEVPEVDQDAAAYCEQAGGRVATRAFNYGTNLDSSQWVQLATPNHFCEFAAESGTSVESDSRIAIDLETLYSEEPTLATLAYLESPPMGDAPAGVNPALAYCHQLGGSASPTGLENASGGGWVKKGDPLLIMCVFADGSMIDAWGLTFRANGSIRGIDLSTILP